MRKQTTKPSRLRIDDLDTIQPQTEGQLNALDAWYAGDNLVLAGSAGTGKTFLAMYMALEDVLDKSNFHDKVVIVRSVVPTREVGFLPGSLEEKLAVFHGPYRSICGELFDDEEAYDKLVSFGSIEFVSTSYIRGSTFNNCVIVVDECQNLNFHELDSVITRVGRNCRIIFSGDYYQTDFQKANEARGILQFLEIIEQLRKFTTITFTWADIVRSDFVRDYIMTKEMIQNDQD